MARINQIKIRPTHRPRVPSVILILNILLAGAGVAAVASLVMQYGGFDPASLPVSAATLQIIQACIVGWFVFDRLLRLVLFRPRWSYFKANWLDYALIFLLAVAMIISAQIPPRLVSAGALYLIITQVYMLAMLLLRAVNANLRLAGSGLPPGALLMGSFAAMCLIGSGLLMLPSAVHPEFHDRWFYPDAFFTAVSATCVTGLVVADTGRHFTHFGQVVILCLIQLGGLGIMIFGALLGLLAGKALSIRSSKAIGEMLSDNRLGELSRVVRFVVLITFLIEAVGAVLLYPMFREGIDSTAGAVWYAVFHSISSFCNSGFALYGNNFMHGIGQNAGGALREQWQVLWVMGPMIIMGGFGFIVLLDLWRMARAQVARLAMWRRQRKDPTTTLPAHRLSLHSKIVLSFTAVLLIGGAIGVFVLLNPMKTDEQVGGHFNPAAVHDDWREMSTIQKARAAMFQSISARTAGFNTIDMNEMTDAAKLWMCGLMTIGGSPAGTAGGVKTVTVALALLAVWCFLRRRNELEAFGRSIPDVLLRRAVTVLVLYSLLLVTVVLLLCLSMRGEKFIDLLFEACSACGTVGLSTGVTDRLGEFSKFVIIAGMFIGRLGPMTLILALTAGTKKAKYSYPQESVIIG